MSSDVVFDSWRAMGCAVDVVIVGGPPQLLDRAKASIDHLEQRWSRFLPDSDISRLNHAAGSPVQTDPATIVLLRSMLDGWRATAGAFDPTLLAPLVGLGYAASWHDPAAVTSLPHAALFRGDLNALSIDDERCTVRAPRGMCLDAGGIGKGLAGDLVVAELMSNGAEGATVSIGGDICVRGTPPQEEGWLIRLGDPTGADVTVGRLALLEGGVATSGTLRRRWSADDGRPMHHLLDPTSGRPTQQARQIVAVTVVAGTAAWAEVWTKAVIVRGASMLTVLDDHGLGARLTYADGGVLANRAWSTFADNGVEAA
jgi:FAD:protein FMN transferase